MSIVDDFIYIGRLTPLNIAFSYGVFAQLASEMIVRHDSDPVSGHLLGRAVSTGCLAASGLQGRERLNIHWAYEGELRSVVVDAGADGTVRGFVSPRHLRDTAENTNCLFGDRCQLRVIRVQDGKVLSSGTTESILQDPVRDYEFFQSTSDQVETAVTVMIGFSDRPEAPVHLCQGLMLHALPGCDLRRFDQLRTGLEGEDVRDLLATYNAADNYVEDILNRVLDTAGQQAEIHMQEGPPPRFQCTCTRKKMGAVVRALPYSDRMEIVQKKEDVVVHCEFCNTRYALTVDDCIRAWNMGRDRNQPPK